MSLDFPYGTFGLYADDDDVIGLTVARTYPKGWPIIRTDPPFMDAFTEFDVGSFLADCLTHAAAVQQLLATLTPPSAEGTPNQ